MVQLTANSYDIHRAKYLRILKHISRIAEILQEGHSLRAITVELKETSRHYTKPKRHTSFYENVLEPLGTVYGIRDVWVFNVTPEFELKLKMAMQGKEAACTPAEELFETMMVKTHGVKRPKVFRCKNFYESR